MADLREPLRVGLLVDTLQLPAWVRQIIADIQASQYARIVLVVQKDGPRRAPASLAHRIWRSRSRLAYLAYRWIDDRVFRHSPDAFAGDDAAALLANAALMPVTVRETRFCDYVSEEDVARIRDARPDVLLRFGFRILKGPILQAARTACGRTTTATITSTAVDLPVSGKSCTSAPRRDRCFRS